MSLLQMYAPTGGTWSLNVTSFSSPISATLSSVQTKSNLQHFPIKVTQANLQLNVIFGSVEEFLLFQTFVRGHQKAAVLDASLITMNWPERNINAWTGTIKSFQAGYDRFVYAPTASFEVDLVDSMASSRTELATIVDNQQAFWLSVVGYGSPDGVLAPPTLHEWQVATAGGDDGTGGGLNTSVTGPARKVFAPGGNR